MSRYHFYKYLRRTVSNVAIAGIQIYCVHPNRISLTAEVRMPDNSKIPCDMDSTTQRLAAQSYLDLNLVAIVKDESGRKLDNFSSLAIDWTLSKPDLAQLSSPNSILLETKDAGGYQTIARSKYFCLSFR